MWWRCWNLIFGNGIWGHLFATLPHPSFSRSGERSLLRKTGVEYSPLQTHQWLFCINEKLKGTIFLDNDISLGDLLSKGSEETTFQSSCLRGDEQRFKIFQLNNSYPYTELCLTELTRVLLFKIMHYFFNKKSRTVRIGRYLWED